MRQIFAHRYKWPHDKRRRILRRAAILLLLLTPCIAMADPWRGEDTARELIWQGISLLDYGQTRDIAAKCGAYSETNPLLGDCPDPENVKRYFLAAAALHFGISKVLSVKYRTKWQDATIFVSGAFVLHNFSIGLNVRF